MEQFRNVFETNVFEVAGVTQAFLDLLEKLLQPRIVNVSTAMASLTLYADLDKENFAYRYPVYQASKTVLNMHTINLATNYATPPSKSTRCVRATPKPTLRASKELVQWRRLGNAL